MKPLDDKELADILRSKVAADQPFVSDDQWDQIAAQLPKGQTFNKWPILISALAAASLLLWWYSWLLRLCVLVQLLSQLLQLLYHLLLLFVDLLLLVVDLLQDLLLLLIGCKEKKK